jgi:hypothetical protein
MLLLLQVIAVMPSLINAGIDVANLVSGAKTVLDSGTDPTPEQLAALKTELDALMARINAEPATSQE